MKWFPFAERVGRLLANIPNAVFTLLGLALLAGTLIAAALVKDKNLAVAVATSGSIVGTTLLSLYLPKLIYAAKEEELRREVSASEERDRRHQEERSRQEAEKRYLEAEREIARLESMRINIEAFQPIVKLGLLEVETNLKDFRRQVLGDEAEETWYRKGYRDVYLGVMQIPLKAQLGIDLQRVRVWPGQGNRLMVGAITMTTTADTAPCAEWLLGEVRREFIKDKQFVAFEGDPHDPRVMQLNRAHEQQLRQRLKEGQDFRVFEAGLMRAAEQVLRLLLSPLNKDITVSQAAIPESQELLAFLADHNQRLTARMACSLPARSASKVDPIEALRAE